LKFHKDKQDGDITVSPPARGRGLKSKTYSQETVTVMSPPARGRGLK